MCGPGEIYGIIVLTLVCIGAFLGGVMMMREGFHQLRMLQRQRRHDKQVEERKE